jgi:hypothetical protein
MRLFSALSLSVGLVSGPAFAAQVIKAPIAPGAEMVQTIIAANEPGGPQLIHALIVDPTRKGIRFEAGLGNGTVEEAGGGREAVNAQVLRTGALAGINADFFPWSGDPLGLAIHKGEFVSETGGRSATWGITGAGKVLIGSPAYSGTVIAPGDAAQPLSTAVTALSGVNRKAGAGELVFYSAIYGDKTPAAAATVAVLSAPGMKLTPNAPLIGSVLSVTDEPGAVATRADGFILTGTGPAAEWLKANAVPGKTLTVSVSLTEDGKDWSDVVEAVSGGPILLTAGGEAAQLIEGRNDSFSTTRHPRSAVGVTKDGKVMLVAVDGRQTFSRGISLPELAKVMKDLGAVDAINLDGGGSTCLSIFGMVINNPSDGVVRNVADSLLVYADGAPDPWLVGRSDGPIPTLTAGKTMPPPAELGKARLWGSADGGIFVDQKGTVYGYKGGTAAVLALSQDGTTISRAPVNVLPGPAGKILTAWKDGTLVITVRDVNNNPVQGQEVGLKQPGGKTTEVTTGADGTVKVPAGWLKDEKAPVALTSGVMSKEWPEKK